MGWFAIALVRDRREYCQPDRLVLEDTVHDVKSLLAKEIAVRSYIDNNVTKTTVFLYFGLQIAGCVESEAVFGDSLKFVIEDRVLFFNEVKNFCS
jgi:hypothetical protein